jgi:2-dehydropantoate 2-reductase
MEILIIGAGALGCLFGALLAPRASVSLFTTNTDHARAINQSGLVLIGMDNRQRNLTIPVLTDPAAYGRRADLILLCTKARSTESAAATARQLLAENGLILTLQNGLGNLEKIIAAVGPERAAAGITAQGATLLAPGQVRHAGNGVTQLAVGPGQSAAIAAIAALFNRAGIETRINDDVDTLLWSKLIVNVGINALAALLRVPNGVLTEVAECGELMAEAVAEAVAVARGLGIDFDDDQQLDRVRQVCIQTRANRASMLQDVLRGAPTEIDVINGAVVAKGREVGIATPVNLLLTRLVKALEATAAQRIAPLAATTTTKETPCNPKS